MSAATGTPPAITWPDWITESEAALLRATAGGGAIETVDALWWRVGTQPHTGIDIVADAKGIDRQRLRDLLTRDALNELTGGVQPNRPIQLLGRQQRAWYGRRRTWASILRRLDERWVLVPAILLLVAGLVALTVLRARERHEDETPVVAARALATGDTLALADLKRGPEAPLRRYLSAVAQLEGLRVDNALEAGKPVTQRAIQDANGAAPTRATTPGRTTITFVLPAAAVPVSVRPGDRVSLLVTPRESEPGAPSPETVDDALIVAIDRLQQTTSLSVAISAEARERVRGALGRADIFVVRAFP